MGMEIPDEEFELNEMNLSAVCEVMNQMMGASRNIGRCDIRPFAKHR